MDIQITILAVQIKLIVLYV